MAEVGLAAAIIGLAGTGAKLGLTLFSIADTIGSAGQDARLIGTEVSLFSQALSALSKSLHRKSDKTSKLQKVALKLRDACRSLIKDLRTLLGNLSRRGPGRDAFPIRTLRARVLWLFNKSRVLYLRTSLESFKMTLILLVTSMDYAEAAYRDAPESIRDPLRFQVESMMRISAEVNGNLSRCGARLSHLDGLNVPPNSITQETSPEEVDAFQRRNSMAIQREATILNRLGQLSRSLDDAESSPVSDSSQTSLTEQQLAQDNQMAIESIQATSLQAHQVVNELVTEVLSPEPETEWSWEASEFTQKDDLSQENSTSANATASRSADEVRFVETGPNDRSTSPSPQKVHSSRNGDNSTSDSERLQRLEQMIKQLQNTLSSSNLRVPLEDKVEVTVPMDDQNLESTDANYEPATQHDDRLSKLEEMLLQRLEAKLKIKSSPKPQAPVKFKDAVGRKFSFPFGKCNTWEGMFELVKEAFKHVEIIGPHVDAGHFDLVGGDGEIILPQLWETMIRPDAAITMHMWPMPELPPPPPPPPPPLPSSSRSGLPPPPPPPPAKKKSTKTRVIRAGRTESFSF